jgi:hypothetical protein
LNNKPVRQDSLFFSAFFAFFAVKDPQPTCWALIPVFNRHRKADRATQEGIKRHQEGIKKAESGRTVLLLTIFSACRRKAGGSAKLGIITQGPVARKSKRQRFKFQRSSKRTAFFLSSLRSRSRAFYGVVRCPRLRLRPHRSRLVGKPAEPRRAALTENERARIADGRHCKP